MGPTSTEILDREKYAIVKQYYCSDDALPGFHTVICDVFKHLKYETKIQLFDFMLKIHESIDENPNGVSDLIGGVFGYNYRYTKCGLATWHTSKHLPRILDFILEIEDEVKHNWDYLTWTLGREDGDKKYGLAIWNDSTSKELDTILKFWKNLIFSTKKETNISELFGIKDGRHDRGISVWRNTKHYNKMLNFVLDISEYAEKDWFSFSRILGGFTETREYGLYAWRDSPYFLRLLKFIKNCAPEASKSWKFFNYTFKNLLQYKDTKHVELILELIERNLNMASKNFATFSTVFGYNNLKGWEGGLNLWKDSDEFPQLLKITQHLLTEFDNFHDVANAIGLIRTERGETESKEYGLYSLRDEGNLEEIAKDQKLMKYLVYLPHLSKTAKFIQGVKETVNVNRIPILVEFTKRVLEQEKAKLTPRQTKRKKVLEEQIAIISEVSSSLPSYSEISKKEIHLTHNVFPKQIRNQVIKIISTVLKQTKIICVMRGGQPFAHAFDQYKDIFSSGISRYIKLHVKSAQGEMYGKNGEPNSAPVPHIMDILKRNSVKYLLFIDATLTHLEKIYLLTQIEEKTNTSAVLVAQKTPGARIEQDYSKEKKDLISGNLDRILLNVSWFKTKEEAQQLDDTSAMGNTIAKIDGKLTKIKEKYSNQLAELTLEAKKDPQKMIELDELERQISLKKQDTIENFEKRIWLSMINEDFLDSDGGVIFETLFDTLFNKSIPVPLKKLKRMARKQSKRKAYA